MAQTLIREAARALSPRPIMMLAELGRCPRPTAKSWATGYRRPKVVILELLRDAVQARGLTGLARELDHHIRQREWEPRHRSGFWLIDPITRQNKANRLGRPKRN